MQNLSTNYSFIIFSRFNHTERKTQEYNWGSQLLLNKKFKMKRMIMKSSRQLFARSQITIIKRTAAGTIFTEEKSHRNSIISRPFAAAHQSLVGRVFDTIRSGQVKDLKDIIEENQLEIDLNLRNEVATLTNLPTP